MHLTYNELLRNADWFGLGSIVPRVTKLDKLDAIVSFYLQKQRSKIFRINFTDKLSAGKSIRIETTLEKKKDRTELTTTTTTKHEGTALRVCRTLPEGLSFPQTF